MLRHPVFKDEMIHQFRMWLTELARRRAEEGYKPIFHARLIQCVMWPRTDPRNAVVVLQVSIISDDGGPCLLVGLWVDSKLQSIVHHFDTNTTTVFGQLSDHSYGLIYPEIRP